MSQLASKVIVQTRREHTAARAGEAVRQALLALTTTTGLAITGALVVAVAIAGPVLGSQRAAAPAATTNVPPTVRTEATSAINSASVAEWAAAEGGYFGGAAYVPGALAGYAGPEVWAVVEGGPFGSQAYVPGPLAGYAGPAVWAELEGGALGGLTQPSPEVVPD